MNADAQLIAENSVVGGLMIDASKWSKVKKTVSVDDFKDIRTRAIFKAISQQLDNNQPADVITLGDTQGVDLGYAAALVKHTPSAANVCAYAKEVKKIFR